jgi:glutathione S-transferase
MADAMYAPVVTRFRTYDVQLEGACAEYADRILALPEMQEWIAAAQAEPDEVQELDAEF